MEQLAIPDFSRLVAEVNGCGMMPSQVLEARLSELGVGHVVEPVATDLRLKESSYGWLKLLLQQGRLELPNHPPLLRQLRNLSFERLPSGGVRIHVPTHVGHDDLCSALALELATELRGRGFSEGKARYEAAFALMHVVRDERAADWVVKVAETRWPGMWSDGSSSSGTTVHE